MLTLQDCIAFCGLTEDQLEAIARHQHLADVVAAEWAENMLATEAGRGIIESILCDEIACARARGDLRRARRYEAGLGAFRARRAR